MAYLTTQLLFRCYRAMALSAPGKRGLSLRVPIGEVNEYRHSRIYPHPIQVDRTVMWYICDGSIKITLASPLEALISSEWVLVSYQTDSIGLFAVVYTTITAYRYLRKPTEEHCDCWEHWEGIRGDIMLPSGALPSISSISNGCNCGSNPIWLKRLRCSGF
jgi:hypothetical protein